MIQTPVDFAGEFARLEREGLPEKKIEAAGMSVRLVRVSAATIGSWDSHEDGPETAIVWSGDFKVEFDDGGLPLETGQLCVVPKQARHRGRSDHGAQVILLRRLDYAT